MLSCRDSSSLAGGRHFPLASFLICVSGGILGVLFTSVSPRLVTHGIGRGAARS
jgi:hypothetical protein